MMEEVPGTFSEGVVDERLVQEGGETADGKLGWMSDRFTGL